MSLYIRKQNPIEATKWFKMGDHPAVTPLPPKFDTYNHDYERTDVGCLTVLGGSKRAVHPTDWVITGTQGEYYVWPDSTFSQLYVAYEKEDNGLFFTNIRKLIRILKIKWTKSLQKT